MSVVEPTAEVTNAIKGMAQLWALSMQTPVLRNPGEYGMECEEITIPSFDGVKLKS